MGHEDMPAWLSADGGDPLVYVTFGTVFNRDVSVIAKRQEIQAMPAFDDLTVRDYTPNAHEAEWVEAAFAPPPVVEVQP